MIDPISDMLTRIRNATRAGQPEVLVPLSNLKKKMAALMKKENCIENFTEEESGKKRLLKISLKYFKDERGKKTSHIQNLERVSRQGQRVYVGKNQIPIVKSGYGFVIISTSRGLMTDGEARKSGLGGEVICKIW